MTLAHASSFSGDVSVSAGTLTVGAAGALPAVNVAVNGGAAAGGTLDLAGQNPAINGLGGASGAVAGQIVNSAAALSTLTVGNNNATNSSAAGINGNIALIKTGSGTQTLSGVSGYTGGTTVAQGVLVSAGGAALGNSAVTLNGGTLRLAAGTPYSGPVSVTGFTGDDIAEASASTPSAGTNVQYNGWWWYEKGAPNSAQGLPNWAATGGTLSSVYTQPGGGHTLFQLQPYGPNSGTTNAYPNNVAAVGNGASLTMTMNNPAKFSALQLLFSGQGGGNYNLTLNFADSSTYTFSANPYPDWTSGASTADPFAYTNAGLVNSGGGWNTFYAGQLSLFENDFAVPTVDQSKVLDSVTFNVTSGGGGLMIFALSGLQSDGNLLNNDLVVNSDSTVDVRTSLTAQMGNLTIGNHKLSLTGDSGASLTLGSATLTGGTATFDVQSATTLILSGVVSGASGIVKNNLGTLVLGSTANTYSGSTSINAGVLQFAAPGSIGGSGRSVTVANGGIAAAAYPMDNGFLNRIVQNSNTSVMALVVSSSNNLDFSSTAGASLPNASLGAIGSQVYSGTLTPSGSSYRLGGGGGKLTVVNPLTGANNLVVNGAGGGTVVLYSADNNYTGSTIISGGTLQIGFALGPPSGAAAIYSFTNVNGTTVNNDGSLGSPKNATLSSGATIVADPTAPDGSAMQLTGGNSNTGFLAVNQGPGNVGLDLSGGNWTASIWYRGIFPSGDMGGNNSEWRTLYHAGTDDSYQTIIHTPDNSIESLWGGNQNSGGTITTGDNGWHMLTTVGNASAGWTKFYIDGTYVSQTTWASTSDIWSIGARGSDNAQQFANYLDDFYFYQRALTPSDIATLYSATLNNISSNIAGQLPSGSPVSITGGSMLDLNGSAQTIASLSGDATGTVALGGGTLTTGGDNTSTTFAGTIADAGGASANSGGSLIKIGNGTMVLSGSNTYSGGTDVQDGTLVLASPAALEDGTSLTIGADAAAIFAAAPAAAPSAPAAVSPVPEPGTLALLATLWIAAACYRFFRRRK